MRMSALKEVYLRLPPDLRDKLRGRFTQLLGELSVLEELQKQGYDVELKSGRGGYDLLVNKKRIQVKACNIDDAWVKLRGIAGCSGVNPSKFDVLVYVELDDSLKNIAYYIFSRDETQNFPYASKEKKWDARKYSESENRTLNNPFDPSHFNEMTMAQATELNGLLKASLGRWDKIY